MRRPEPKQTPLRRIRKRTELNQPLQARGAAPASSWSAAARLRNPRRGPQEHVEVSPAEGFLLRISRGGPMHEIMHAAHLSQSVWNDKLK
eukprot:g405.t1